jgi:RHS repeat-associated protein
MDGNTRYITGPGGLPIEQVDGSNNVLYYYQDQLGSTRGLLDGSGNTQATYTFDAYGNITSKTGSANTPFQYAGQYTDSESGLQYLRARHYDPATAQFISVDPIVGATGEPYTYTAGGPLNAADPVGLGCGLNPVCYAGEAKDWTVGHAPGIERQIAISGLNGAVSFMGQVGGDVTSGNPIRVARGFGYVYLNVFLGLADAPGEVGLVALSEEGATTVGDEACSVDFIAHPDGGVAVVPKGAAGPFPTKRSGFQFTGGRGGHGLNSQVTDVRVMDPTPPGVKYPHPSGYVSYSNRRGQAVNPYTGKTIGKSDPWWHIDWPK